MRCAAPRSPTKACRCRSASASPPARRAQPLQPGTAARIFTGAPVPAGADAIVMQEDTEPLGDGARAHPARAVARASGSAAAARTSRAAATVLARGERLAPAALGLAASIGRDRLQVARRPRVALFSTGDELVMPGEVAPEAMQPGAIYNSNRFFLRSLLLRLGCEVQRPRHRARTAARPPSQALRDAAADNDLIVTSGGVSVGEEDHIKPAVQQLGSLDLWQIAMKPGKPLRLRRRCGERALHRPAGQPGLQLRHLPAAGAAVPAEAAGRDAAWRRARVQLPAHFDWPRPDKRREFLRARRNAAGGLELFPNQSSGVLTSTVWADGLVDMPAGPAIAHGRRGALPAAGGAAGMNVRDHATSPRCARRWGRAASRCRRAAKRWARCATS